MRYLVGLVCVLAGLVALPLSVSAQDAEEGATSAPSVEQPAASSDPAPEEPALRLELDDGGVRVAPGYLPYTFQEMELRLRRATFGLGFSVAALVIGFGMGMAAAGGAAVCIDILGTDVPCSPPRWVAPVGYTGLVLAVGGLAGTIASSVVRRGAKRKLRYLQEADYRRPRRVQWDLARSRVVF